MVRRTKEEAEQTRKDLIEAARKVFADGQAMLKKCIEGRWLQANAAVAFYPANTVGDDHIEVYADESRSQVLRFFYVRLFAFIRRRLSIPSTISRPTAIHTGT